MLLTTKLPAHEVRAISVRAECDPRTVTRALAGERVQPMNAARIEAALLALGYLQPRSKP